MAAPTQQGPRYYVWEVAGSPVVVHLHWDVIDRLAAEIKRDFSALPKRAAETGGLLIGSVRDGDPAVVRVDDFKTVPCAHANGPSYLFTQEDGAGFVQTFMRSQRDVTPSAYAVGFFRTHTREGFALAAEDIELLDHFFPGASEIALLIKPYAARPNSGAFFIREQGVFPETAQHEFPLRRREIPGDDATPRDMLALRPAGIRRSAAVPAPADRERGAAGIGSGPPLPNPPVPAKLPRTRDRWMWVLPVIFLLLGTLLGFEAALTMASRGAGVAANSAQDFSLSLAVARNDGNLNVSWDTQAPAIRAAQKGVLEIEDAGSTKPVDLDQAQLRNGTLIYRNASNSVRFRLTVYPPGRVSISETRLWKQ